MLSDDWSQFKTGWTMQPWRWASEYTYGRLPWWHLLGWDVLPLVGRIIPWAGIMNCVKRRKWTEHKHSPFSSSWIWMLCELLLQVAVEHILHMWAKINPFFLRSKSSGDFMMATGRITKIGYWFYKSQFSGIVMKACSQSLWEAEAGRLSVWACPITK